MVFYSFTRDQCRVYVVVVAHPTAILLFFSRFIIFKFFFRFNFTVWFSFSFTSSSGAWLVLEDRKSFILLFIVVGLWFPVSSFYSVFCVLFMAFTLSRSCLHGLFVVFRFFFQSIHFYPLLLLCYCDTDGKLDAW